jgi:hypothetical protein
MQSDKNQKAEPFFIVGAPRSGTTLLRLILGHHSEVCKCEEMEFVAPELQNTATVADMEDYIRRLELDRGFRLSGYSINKDLLFHDMARDFLRQRQPIDNKPTVGATVHHHFEQLPKIWPNAKYICLSRDPRDVARSAVQMGWTGCSYYGADYWLAAYSSWQSLRTKVAASSLLEVRFEDLIADSQTCIKRVSDFLNISYDPTMMDIDKDTTYSPPDPYAANSWQNSADSEEIALIEARIGATILNDSGYPPSVTPQVKITAAKLREIRRHDIINRVRFRVNRYGLSLWLQGIISRRLPFRAYRNRIKLTIDAVDNTFLK